jgi:hypothetical protein
MMDTDATKLNTVATLKNIAAKVAASIAANPVAWIAGAAAVAALTVAIVASTNAYNADAKAAE